MEEQFFNAWSIEVTGKNASFAQRFRIVGSDSTDGTYQGLVGVSVPRVSGNAWRLVTEWNDGNSDAWQFSAMRSSFAYRVDGLVKIVAADDNVAAAQDGDYDDLILLCRYLEPSVNPLFPTTNPFPFTYPERCLKPCKEDPYQGYPKPCEPEKGT